ncbi:MAG: RsmE family RNA methyltransferase [Bacteroidota bacterium]
MSIPFFYEPSIQESKQPYVLSESTSKHCVQVLRMKENALIHLTDGKGNLFKANIISADKHKSVAIIEQTIYTEANPNKISIGISLLKNADRLEWMFEKITEIGVTEIFPLICKRTEQQRFKTERMQQILVSAMLQSQQCWLPILHEPIAINKLILQSNNHQKIIAHCEDAKKTVLTDLPKSTDSLILIGPEGDFTNEEISLAMQSHFVPVSLGNTRLRTETAGLVAITILANF